MEHSVAWTVDPHNFLRKRALQSLSAAGRLKKKITDGSDVGSIRPDLETFFAVQPIHGGEADTAIQALRAADNAEKAIHAIERIVRMNRSLIGA